MLFFGVLLPMLLGFTCAYQGATRLKRSFGAVSGTILAVVLGLEVGIVLSSLVHGMMIKHMFDAFDMDFWTRAASASTWTSFFWRGLGRRQSQGLDPRGYIRTRG